MQLLRVQVPEFRALKDVDISFEPEFTPQVFPLGSLNGGGKSTLLQLIFVLLHCFWDNVRREKYLKNITELISNYNSIQFSKLATITILTKHGKVRLEYFYGNRDDIIRILDIEKENHFTYDFDFSYFFVLIHLLDHPKTSKNSKEEFENIIKILKEILYDIEEKIFLISPSNQPYLFLTKEERRALFTANTKQIYDDAVKVSQGSLLNFYTFDFVDVLVEVFRRARANDFKERNKDNPFAHTEKLEADINNLFMDGKKIASLIIEQQRHTQDEIQGVYFKLPDGTEIYPEDLSHGELKRLAIFVLLKHHDIQDSIVLIDEIENGFHPDWQYQIVRDLLEWGKNNQYILATHSYELCTALTPAHVKELEPRLIKN